METKCPSLIKNVYRANYIFLPMDLKSNVCSEEISFASVICLVITIHLHKCCITFLYNSYPLFASILSRQLKRGCTTLVSRQSCNFSKRSVHSIMEERNETIWKHHSANDANLFFHDTVCWRVLWIIRAICYVGSWIPTEIRFRSSVERVGEC